jgi:hypothetical protein
MSETTPAASSPAEVDVFNGQQVNPCGIQSVPENGEVPERFKPTDQNADAEPCCHSGKDRESEGESLNPQRSRTRNPSRSQ